jgi:hypothetical protein
MTPLVLVEEPAPEAIGAFLEKAPRQLRRLAMSDPRPSTSGLFDVAGKSALVTGGSRGIGLMIARGLVQAGARDRLLAQERRRRRRRSGAQRVR